MSDETRETVAAGEAPANETAEERVTRRRLLSCGAVAAAAAAGLAGQAHAQDDDAEDAERIVHPLPFKEQEKLKQVGGWVQDELYNGTQVVIARTTEDRAVCVGGVCTHERGLLMYNHDKGRFVCPLHGAEFDLEGQPVVGPLGTDPDTIGAVKLYKSDLGVMVFPDEDPIEEEIEE